MQFILGLLLAAVSILGYIIFTGEPLVSTETQPKLQYSTAIYDFENPTIYGTPCVQGSELTSYSKKVSSGLEETFYCSSQDAIYYGNSDSCSCFFIGSRSWWVIENWQNRLTAADYQQYPVLKRGNFSGFANWQHLNITGCELNETQCQQPYTYSKVYPFK